MYKTHADKGKEPWEIYAWCVRDLIAKVGNMKKLDNSVRHSVNYNRKIFGLPKYDCPEEALLD